MLSASGLVTNLLTGAQFGALIRDDVQRYTEVKTRAKMVVE